LPASPAFFASSSVNSRDLLGLAAALDLAPRDVAGDFLDHVLAQRRVAHQREHHVAPEAKGAR
jgi:hypothetical protein